MGRRPNLFSKKTNINYKGNPHYIFYVIASIFFVGFIYCIIYSSIGLSEFVGWACVLFFVSVVSFIIGLTIHITKYTKDDEKTDKEEASQDGTPTFKKK